MLRATMKGHFFSLSRLMDSSVWGSRPCMMSTTRMAMSHRELPLFLRLLHKSFYRIKKQRFVPPNISLVSHSDEVEGKILEVHVGYLPKRLVSRCVDDQHPRNLQVLLVELKETHFQVNPANCSVIKNRSRPRSKTKTFSHQDQNQ